MGNLGKEKPAKIKDDEVTEEVELALLGEYSQRAALSLEDYESVIMRSAERYVISEVLETLHPREAIVIQLRFNEGMALKDIGRRLGVCQERVRQLEAKALRKLRHHSRSRPIAGAGPNKTRREVEEDAEALRRRMSGEEEEALRREMAEEREEALRRKEEWERHKRRERRRRGVGDLLEHQKRMFRIAFDEDRQGGRTVPKKTISLTMEKEHWVEMINSVESKIRLIERGDYGAGDDDGDPDNAEWLASLNVVLKKLEDALHSKRIKW